jgi:hypothetical protein
MPFVSAYNALFADGLVEQVIALTQANQAAAIDALGVTPQFGTLDYIADYHKGPTPAPNYPSLIVVAGEPSFDPESSAAERDYLVAITLFLDIRIMDPDQLADWSYKYARVLDQIFSTITNKTTDLTPFTTAQPITWPLNTAPRSTTPFGVGSVCKLFIHAHHIGILPADESAIPGHRIGIPMEFHMVEL